MRPSAVPTRRTSRGETQTNEEGGELCTSRLRRRRVSRSPLRIRRRRRLQCKRRMGDEQGCMCAFKSLDRRRDRAVGRRGRGSPRTRPASRSARAPAGPAPPPFLLGTVPFQTHVSRSSCGTQEVSAHLGEVPCVIVVLVFGERVVAIYPGRVEPGHVSACGWAAKGGGTRT